MLIYFYSVFLRLNEKYAMKNEHLLARITNIEVCAVSFRGASSKNVIQLR